MRQKFWGQWDWWRLRDIPLLPANIDFLLERSEPPVFPCRPGPRPARPVATLEHESMTELNSASDATVSVTLTAVLLWHPLRSTEGRTKCDGECFLWTPLAVLYVVPNSWPIRSKQLNLRMCLLWIKRHWQSNVLDKQDHPNIIPNFPQACGKVQISSPCTTQIKPTFCFLLRSMLCCRILVAKIFLNCSLK